jgi:non-specific protein-tyrosine kinase
VDLREYLRLLRWGWLWILVFALVGAGVGVALTLATPATYQATVQLFVATDSGTSSSTTGLAQGNTFIQERVQSYTSIASSPAVTRAVIKAEGLGLTNQQLADKITADAPPNKVLINLHVTDHDPATAARLANSTARQFAAVVESTEQTNANGSSVVKLTVIHPASQPRHPVKPDGRLYTFLGLLAGLIIGIGVVIVRDLLDNTVRSSEDFEDLGLAVLGTVPLDKRTRHAPNAFRDDPRGARAEAYRLLRTNLQFVNVDRTPRTIAVSSSVPGEGKSTTALNLAAALAESGSRVCLVEADLRRPTIALATGLAPEVGLTTVLTRRIPLADALQSLGPNFLVLTSGPVPPNPSELLDSERVQALINEVAASVDYTIIDSAPLLPVADGAQVAALAEATLIVHRAGKTSHDHVSRSLATLRRIGNTPAGIVLNMITRRDSRYDYEDDDYYRYHADVPAPAEVTEPAATAPPVHSANGSHLGDGPEADRQPAEEDGRRAGSSAHHRR